jgi:hypothetical protein
VRIPERAMTPSFGFGTRVFPADVEDSDHPS